VTGTFVLVWITCAPLPGVSVLIGGHHACVEQRAYYDSMDECIAAREALPADEDGLPPLLSACANVRRSP
jgi:hypothetical protein